MAKKIVVIVIGILLYIRGITQGYLLPMRGGWMFATALIYIFMHYVTLSWHQTVHKNALWVCIYTILVSIIILSITRNIWLAISALLWHAAIGSVVYSLEEVLTNRRKFSQGEFFQSGGALFSIFFTLSFITAFMGRNQVFNLTCDDIYKASNTVINYSEEKFNVGYHQIQDRQRSILGNMLMSSGLVEETNTQIDDALSGYNTTSFAGMIQTYRQQLIDETIANQKNVNQKVCQVFVDQINGLYEKPGFRVSVILLMFLVISPLLRISLYVISGINMLIFSILKKAKVYKTTKETVEIDKIG